MVAPNYLIAFHDKSQLDKLYDGKTSSFFLTFFQYFHLPEGKSVVWSKRGPVSFVGVEPDPICQ